MRMVQEIGFGPNDHRIYGRRNRKRKAEQIKQCVEQVIQQEA
jgi:hypothetical protein